MGPNQVEVVPILIMVGPIPVEVDPIPVVAVEEGQSGKEEVRA